MGGDPRPDSLVYDANGNVRFQYTRTPPLNTPIREDRMSYYAADGTLRATDHRTRVTGNQSFTFTFEEYWYDAVGRRVLTRTRRDCSPEDYDLESCSISTVRRTIWDGVKEVFEIQMPDTTVVALVENDTAALPNLGATINAEPMARNPFFGRVAYTNGPGLDQPLSVTRWGYADTAFVGSAAQQRFEQWREPFTIVPHWNMRGQADHGTTATGGGATCGGGTPPGGGASSGRCALVYWPYGWTAYWQKTYRQPSWNGSLLDQKRDGSQLIYKRNRYYDPSTGRFTQEDPIGLAGGSNLYGFANSDPVNFGDPLGLSASCCVALGAGTFGRVVAPALHDIEVEARAWATLNTAYKYLVALSFVSGRRGAIARPTRTSWGWTGSPAWNLAKRALAEAPEEGATHLSVLGKVPTQAEAEQLIAAGGGRVLRADRAHAPGGVSTHTFDHINYVNEAGREMTVRVTEVVNPYNLTRRTP
jgi:RHS repeat-associated protein